MSKAWKVAMAGLLVALLAAPVLGGADANDAKKATPGEAGAGAEGASWARAVTTIGVCLGAAFAVAAGSFGIARIGSTCIEAMARQPEAARDMFAPMVVTAGMVEVGMLFTIVVCLILG